MKTTPTFQSLIINSNLQLNHNMIQQANGNEPKTEEEKWRMVEEAAEHYGKFLNAMGFDWEKLSLIHI